MIYRETKHTDLYIHTKRSTMNNKHTRTYCTCTSMYTYLCIHVLRMNIYVYDFVCAQTFIQVTMCSNQWHIAHNLQNTAGDKLQHFWIASTAAAVQLIQNGMPWIKRRFFQQFYTWQCKVLTRRWLLTMIIKCDTQNSSITAVYGDWLFYTWTASATCNTAKLFTST